MRHPHYLDPLGNRLPALERNILRLRSTQMTLVLLYTEELKQKILDLIQHSDKFRRLMGSDKPERVPKGTKGEREACLLALIADGAISQTEKDEIIRLIDYRNRIGHEIKLLISDINSNPYARDSFRFLTRGKILYDYEAIDRLRFYLKKLSGPNINKMYVTGLRMDAHIFHSPEQALLADIARLRSKIERQFAQRKQEISRLNNEMQPDESASDDEHPGHPLNQYDDKRLTKRGEEVCYRLFDRGKSPMAVAHLIDISLAAARKRKRMWAALGGISRPHVDLESLPRRKFYIRDDD